MRPNTIKNIVLGLVIMCLIIALVFVILNKPKKEHPNNGANCDQLKAKFNECENDKANMDCDYILGGYEEYKTNHSHNNVDYNKMSTDFETCKTNYAGCETECKKKIDDINVIFSKYKIDQAVKRNKVNKLFTAYKAKYPSQLEPKR
jgi:hypothetical protein